MNFSVDSLWNSVYDGIIGQRQDSNKTVDASPRKNRKEGKMMKRTNSKEVRQAIREHIADYYENDYETFEANAKAICNQREDYLVIGARKLAEVGEFIVAYFDARAFREDVLEEDADESSKYNDDQVWKLYCNLIGAEGSKILRNGGWIK